MIIVPTMQHIHIPYPSTPTFANFKIDYIRALNYTPTTTTIQQQADPAASSNPGGDGRPPKRGTFVGTVKLHGTNASIVFKNGEKAHPQIQARTWVVSRERDNSGTHRLLSAAPLSILVDEILRIRNKGSNFSEIFIVGEMAGKGIQKDVAINHIQPFFAIFNLRIDGKWVDIREYKTVALPKHRVFNLAQYKTFVVQIDFEKDTIAVEAEMERYTAEVDNKCPFSAVFVDAGGKKLSGPGEGIVWTMVRPDDANNTDKGHSFDDTRLRNFKTKGERFSTVRAPRKPKTNASGPAAQFAVYALAERRFEQGIEFLEQEQARTGRKVKGVFDRNLVGAFVKWVTEDAIREERNKMERMGVSEKDARRELESTARQWYIAKCANYV
jgi:hypothetical protein